MFSLKIHLLKITILLSLIMMSLCSCAITRPTPAETMTTPPLATHSREQTLLHLQNWQLNGKLAIQSAKNATSAALNWRQQQQRYSISLLGPLGSGELTIIGRPGFVRLQMSNGQFATSQSPEQLLSEHVGFRLPVSYLYYWIRSLPAPHVTAKTHYDANGRLRELQQQGWKIQFLSYIPARGIDLPSKIFISSSLFKIKIIIYQWQIM